MLPSGPGAWSDDFDEPAAVVCSTVAARPALSALHHFPEAATSGCKNEHIGAHMISLLDTPDWRGHLDARRRDSRPRV